MSELGICSRSELMELVDFRHSNLESELVELFVLNFLLLRVKKMGTDVLLRIRGVRRSLCERNRWYVTIAGHGKIRGSVLWGRPLWG